MPRVMSLREARGYFEAHLDRLREAFRAAHAGPTGGLINPRVVAVDGRGRLEIRCHYDGYDRGDDAWTWYLDPGTMHFYH